MLCPWTHPHVLVPELQAAEPLPMVRGVSPKPGVDGKRSRGLGKQIQTDRVFTLWLWTEVTALFSSIII